MKKNTIALLLIISLGAFLRFYKLDWGNGIFPHPDERNIAVVAETIQPPIDSKFFTKGTFSYGSLIPYTAYFIKTINQKFVPSLFGLYPFKYYVFVLRVISALSAVFSILLIFLIGQRFWSRRVGIMSALLLTFSPGLIQAAHFGTFESSLTFLYLLVFYFFLVFWQTKRFIYFCLSFLFIIISCAIKINSIIFLPILILGFLFFLKQSIIVKFILGIILTLVIFPLLTLLLSPYYLTSGFRGMLNYERGVVTGTLDVFYTKEFINSIPVWFQMIKIIPFIINPLFAVILPVMLVISLFTFFKNFLSARTNLRTIFPEFILVVFLVILFFPNAFLFSKWTRYIVPSIPFFLLLITIILEKWQQKISNMFLYLLIIVNTLWGLSFMSIYFHKDVRITASRWMYENIEKNAVLLNETANVVDIPLPENQIDYDKHFNNIIFDFYGIPYNKELGQKLVSDIEMADYIIVPSRRIVDGLARFPNKYPTISNYYKALYSGELGFKNIKEFTSYPRLGNLEFPDYIAEGTFSVFDHPQISIWKKYKKLTTNDISNLLN